ncbi:RhuM family protein [Clostridium sp.]|jgi:hypothetical protein|uniref:RhuM family protein n=1 Tax=Clostridium sp. TaxID=1506 RepID=UPI003EEFC1EA
MFTADAGCDSIEVMVENENVWLTQDMIATIYDKGRSTVAENLLNIFSDGKGYNSKFYNLEAVIAVGFRTNSERAIIFRSWAGSIMKVTAEIAKSFAESEFEKYRIVQDRLFQSDFDKFAKGLLEE